MPCIVGVLAMHICKIPILRPENLTALGIKAN